MNSKMDLTDKGKDIQYFVIWPCDGGVKSGEGQLRPGLIQLEKILNV